MLDCWRENPHDRPSFTRLKELMDEMMQVCSSSSSLQLDITTASEYHCMGTDSDRSDSDDDHESKNSSDINNNEHDTVNDVTNLNKLVPSFRNEDLEVDDVFNAPENDLITSDLDQRSTSGVSTNQKKIKKEFKAPRQRKSDSMRDSTCSHSELLPPSPCSPSMNTNVAFICEL